MELTIIIELTILTIVMFVTSFISGILPLKLTISQSNLKILSYFSMGILIGTSMLIILPEGIEILSTSTQNVAPFVGFPILIGFLVMYIIDNLFTGSSSSHTQKTTHTSLVTSVFGSSISLGLIFHGIVDGISLGSSFAGGETIPLLIFTAIIIHKIPTSFSLSTILHQEGIHDSMLYWHILLFAASSPIASWITFIIVKLLDKSMDIVIGILFLFSAGTFLYVVNHVMSEFSNSDFQSLPTSAESGTDTVVGSHGSTSRLEFGVSLAGILIPVLLSFIKE